MCRARWVSGDSGAGKSTLIGVLAGLHPGYRGRVLIDGVEQRLKSPADARRAGIAVASPGRFWARERGPAWVLPLAANGDAGNCVPGSGVRPSWRYGPGS